MVMSVSDCIETNFEKGKISNTKKKKHLFRKFQKPVVVIPRDTIICFNTSLSIPNEKVHTVNTC